MRPFRIKPVLQTLAVIAALYAGDQLRMGYQASQIEERVSEKLAGRDYEGAINLLRESNQKRFYPKTAQRLARLLTTAPRLSLRDYSQAIILSNQVIHSVSNRDLKSAAYDTLACAYFGNRETDEARNVAEKNQLTQRMNQFAIGRPCQDSVNLEQNRSIASEEKN